MPPPITTTRNHARRQLYVSLQDVRSPSRLRLSATPPMTHPFKRAFSKSSTAAWARIAPPAAAAAALVMQNGAPARAIPPENAPAAAHPPTIVMLSAKALELSMTSAPAKRTKSQRDLAHALANDGERVLACMNHALACRHNPERVRAEDALPAEIVVVDRILACVVVVDGCRSDTFGRSEGRGRPRLGRSLRRFENAGHGATVRRLCGFARRAYALVRR